LNKAHEKERHRMDNARCMLPVVEAAHANGRVDDRVTGRTIWVLGGAVVVGAPLASPLGREGARLARARPRARSAGRAAPRRRVQSRIAGRPRRAPWIGCGRKPRGRVGAGNSGRPLHFTKS
jgi:hypothetical protein